MVFEFPSKGPFGKEAETAFAEIAADIAAEESLIWKTWTEDPEREVCGGVYLFADEASADAYVEMHTKRLEGFGFGDISLVSYDINEGLSQVTHAKLEK